LEKMQAFGVTERPTADCLSSMATISKAQNNRARLRTEPEDTRGENPNATDCLS